MTVKARILQFIEHLNITVAEFERSVGFSNGYIRNIRNSIQPDKAKKISIVYPDLNTGWLLSGEGEMLKQEKPLHPMVAKAEALMDKLIASLEETIESQKQVIEKQNAEIERLQRALLEKEAK